MLWQWYFGSHYYPRVNPYHWTLSNIWTYFWQSDSQFCKLGVSRCRRYGRWSRISDWRHYQPRAVYQSDTQSTQNQASSPWQWSEQFGLAFWLFCPASTWTPPPNSYSSQSHEAWTRHILADRASWCPPNTAYYPHHKYQSRTFTVPQNGNQS